MSPREREARMTVLVLAMADQRCESCGRVIRAGTMYASDERGRCRRHEACPTTLAQESTAD